MSQLESGPIGEVSQGAIECSEGGNADIDGDDGPLTTTSDHSQLKGAGAVPKGSHVKAASKWHVQTGHTSYHSHGFD